MHSTFARTALRVLRQHGAAAEVERLGAALDSINLAFRQAGCCARLLLWLAPHFGATSFGCIAAFYSLLISAVPNMVPTCRTAIATCTSGLQMSRCLPTSADRTIMKHSMLPLQAPKFELLLCLCHMPRRVQAGTGTGAAAASGSAGGAGAPGAASCRLLAGGTQALGATCWLAACLPGPTQPSPGACGQPAASLVACFPASQARRGGG